MAKVAVPVVLRRLFDSEDQWVWQADSRSQPGVTYRVTQDALGFFCDCPARKRCAHIDALIERLGEPAPSTTDFDESDWIDPSASWAAPALPEYRTPKTESEKPETMSTSAWSHPSLSKDAEVGSGYAPPELADDIYTARITEVSDPVDQPKFDDPSIMQTRFFVQFTLEGEDVPEDAELRKYITLPQGYINSGFVSPKSNLYTFMETLGYDMTGRFRVHPPEWVGKRVRLVVKNQAPQSGGDVRPVITDIMPLKKKTEPPKAARRQPDDDDE